MCVSFGTRLLGMFRCKQEESFAFRSYKPWERKKTRSYHETYEYIKNVKRGNEDSKLEKRKQKQNAQMPFFGFYADNPRLSSVHSKMTVHAALFTLLVMMFSMKCGNGVVQRRGLTAAIAANSVKHFIRRATTPSSFFDAGRAQLETACPRRGDRSTRL